MAADPSIARRLPHDGLRTIRLPYDRRLRVQGAVIRTRSRRPRLVTVTLFGKGLDTIGCRCD